MRTDNREALLRGARTCLNQKGYARTRARDVAAAAGVSTSAIGYHFGTTDELLVAALLDGLEEWSTQLDALLHDIPRHPIRERIAQSWARAVESFAGYRGLLAASFELIARADDDPETQRKLRAAVIGARRELARQLLGIDPTADAEIADQAGAFCYALLSGLTVQWLVDPDGLPDPDAVAATILDSFDPA